MQCTMAGQRIGDFEGDQVAPSPIGKSRGKSVAYVVNRTLGERGEPRRGRRYTTTVIRRAARVSPV
jgi:hypothetical protein